MRARINSISARKGVAYIHEGAGQIHLDAGQLPGVPFDFSLVGREVEFDT